MAACLILMWILFATYLPARLSVSEKCFVFLCLITSNEGIQGSGGMDPRHWLEVVSVKSWPLVPLNGMTHYPVFQEQRYKSVAGAMSMDYLYTASLSWKANCREIFRILSKDKVHYRIHNSPPSVFIPSQMNPVHTLTHPFLDFCWEVSAAWSCNLTLAFRLSTQNFVYISLSTTLWTQFVNCGKFVLVCTCFESASSSSLPSPQKLYSGPYPQQNVYRSMWDPI
jgi:hypothetical protein